MINLHADYPGLFKFYGSFLLEWCHKKDFFKVEDIFKDVNIGNEDEDED